MEEIKSGIRRLNNAVFGNPDDPQGQKGVFAEIARIDHNTDEALRLMRVLQSDVRWGG